MESLLQHRLDDLYTARVLILPLSRSRGCRPAVLQALRGHLQAVEVARRR